MFFDGIDVCTVERMSFWRGVVVVVAAGSFLVTQTENTPIDSFSLDLDFDEGGLKMILSCRKRKKGGERKMEDEKEALTKILY